MSTNEKGEMLEPCEERVTMFDERGKVGKLESSLSESVLLSYHPIPSPLCVLWEAKREVE